MDFEWDETKRQANILKHGIDFVGAVTIFTARFIATEDLRRDYGERRYRAIGRFGDAVIQVAYTWRGERRRIISSRRAGRNDRRAYNASDAGAGPQNEEPY